MMYMEIYTEQTVRGAMVDQEDQEAMAELGSLKAMVDRPPWPWPRHSAQPPNPGHCIYIYILE